MTTDVVIGIRQALQDVIAPEVQQIKGKIEALDAHVSALEKIQDARFAEVNTKLESRFSEMNARFSEVNSKPRCPAQYTQYGN